MAKVKSKIVPLSDGQQVTFRSPEKADAKAFLNYCEDVFSTSDFVVTEQDEFSPDLKRSSGASRRLDFDCVMNEPSAGTMNFLGLILNKAETST